MKTIVKKIRFVLVAGLALIFFASAGFAAGDTQAAKKKKKMATATAPGDGAAEPDKILYDRSMADYKKGHYTEARLSLQTLINTYPDSEYLAKAKLAIGDSFYKEGGTSNLTQSIETYKDFITFFPFLDEAAYAQMQVGMAHFRMMEKADRDDSQAQYAEDEFQTFLLKYPNSPLVPKAEQHLRDVQEILADSDFRVAQFYFLKGPRSYRASLARLNEIIDRYPLYSQSDKALWMAGTIYDKAERHEVADKLYARIVHEYPNSSLVDPAKGKLRTAGIPIPQADPAALARAVEERKYAAERPGLIQRTMGVIKSSPDVSMASHTGQPNLQPPAQATSAVDILKPGSAPPGVISGGGGGGVGSGNSVAVETVPAGSDTSVPANTGTGTDAAPADNSAPPADAPNSSLPAPMNSDSTPAPAGAGAAGDALPSPSNTEATTPNAATGPGATASGPPAAAEAAPGTSSEATAGSAAKADPATESTSKKKKKGVKKLIPW